MGAPVKPSASRWTTAAMVAAYVADAWDRRQREGSGTDFRPRRPRQCPCCLAINPGHARHCRACGGRLRWWNTPILSRKQ